MSDTGEIVYCFGPIRCFRIYNSFCCNTSRLMNDEINVMDIPL